jgi:hypothetical protein
MVSEAITIRAVLKRNIHRDITTGAYATNQPEEQL